MTTFQKPADEPRVSVISINPDRSASISTSENQTPSASLKNRFREVLHQLAKLCISSSVSGHERPGAQSHARDQLNDGGYDRERVNSIQEAHGYVGQSVDMTKARLVTVPKPSDMPLRGPRASDRNVQTKELRQPMQGRDHGQLPPLTELVSSSGTDSVSGVYIINMPHGRPVAMKMSTDASAIERQFCVQSTARGVFEHLQRLLKLAGVSLILPTIPACVALYPKLSSFLEDDATNSQSLPLPVLLSLDLPGEEAKRAAAFSMEYIYPFHENHTKYLIRRYLTGCAQADALTCANANDRPSRLLGKLYLGARAPASDPSSLKMHDRPIYVDQLISEGVNVLQLAASMGAALAAFHWCCGLDARGVGFMIGCDIKGQIRIWATGFAHCTTFCRTKGAVQTQLVQAVAENWRSWPPRERGIGCARGESKDMWEHFHFVYLQVSYFLLNPVNKEAKSLPGLFFNTLETSYNDGDTRPSLGKLS